MTSHLFDYTLYNNKKTNIFDNLKNDYTNAIKNVESLLNDNTNINIREKLNKLLDNIKTKEGMINREGFDNHGFQTPSPGNASYDTVVNNQIIPMQSIANDYSTLLSNINTRYNDLCGNVGSLNNNIQRVNGNINTLNQNIQTLSGGFYTKYNKLNNDSTSISNRIDNIYELQDVLNSNNVYDFNANLQNWNNKDMTVGKAHIDDINSLLYSQNSIFIMGTMTTTVLLIFMIYVLKD
jgi:hypothetical protein